MGLMAARPLLLVALQAAWAQVFELQQVAGPEAKSLNGLYLFYVFSKEESPTQGKQPPFLEFKGLAVTDQDGAPLQDVQAREFQATVFLYREFAARIDPSHFCSSAQDVAAGRSRHANELLIQKRDPAPSRAAEEAEPGEAATVFRASFGNSTSPPLRYEFRRTGAYVLALSNCGKAENVTLAGSVSVKNAHGYLPANEYHKMPFYSGLAFIYALLLLAWASMMCRWQKELFAIHYSIFGVIGLGVLEAGLYSLMLHAWNESGMRSELLLGVTLLASVMKSAFSYMLVLVASLGWGVTTPELEDKTVLKVQITSLLYTVLEFVRELMVSFRFSHQVSMQFVLLCLIPVAVLNLVIFWWIFVALSELIERLKQDRQEEKLILFQRLWKVLVTTAAVATCSVIFQFLILPNDFSLRWHYQWFFGDGVSHTLFLTVLLAIVCLWAPSENSKRYALSQQLGEGGGFPEPEEAFDEGEKVVDSAFEIGDVDEEAAASGHRLGPETIGTPHDV